MRLFFHVYLILIHYFFSSVDPATNEILGTVPEMGLEETQEAIDAASKAFVSWSRTTAKVWDFSSFLLTLKLTISSKHRHDVLMKLFGLMKQHHDDLGRLVVSTGDLVCYDVMNRSKY